MVQASETPALVEALYLVVRRAHRLRSVRVRSSCDKAGLVLLGQLMEHGPMRLSDLAGAVQLDTSTVSRQVHSLCDGGFIEVYEDPDDKRARLLKISATGRAEVESVARELGAVLGRAISDWHTADVETLTTLLSRLADDLAPDETGSMPARPMHARGETAP